MYFIKFCKITGTIYGTVDSTYLDLNNLPEDIAKIQLQDYLDYLSNPNNFTINIETKEIIKIEN